MHLGRQITTLHGIEEVETNGTLGALREGIRLSAFAELFNVFNHVNFGNQFVQTSDALEWRSLPYLSWVSG